MTKAPTGMLITKAILALWESPLPPEETYEVVMFE